jgi:hypothetical protein
VHQTEEAIIRAFIAPHRRSRWLLLLESPKKRSKFLDRLNHCIDLDDRYTHALPSNANVVEVLRSHGAPSMCYILSDTAALDGREMPLAEAVPAVELAGWGSIISCISGKLAYFYDERGLRRSLLLRPDGAQE